MDPSKLRILIVDDQESVRELLSAVLTEDGHEVDCAHDGETGVRTVGEGFHDVVLLDIRMPKLDGVEALREIKEQSPGTAVIMMTAYASVETAVTTMKLGAFDYVTKPIDIDEVRAAIQRFTERSDDETPDEPDAEAGDDIVGVSRAWRETLDTAHRAAESDATILLLGESGTGKEVLAHEIHRASPRSSKPFVAVNCSAIPEGLLESELFGHERGAFTGAVKQKRGRFELADGGTAFLDEIGDMSEGLQAKLLRFLQDRTFQRVGGSRPMTVDVRVIAATNRDLEQDIRDGRFREDLFFRLNVVTITAPPLRERVDDIPPLVEHFLGAHAPRGSKPKKVSPKAMRTIMAYDWPGNVRELENAVQRAIVLSRGETIFPEHLPARVRAAAGGEGREDPATGRTMREVERDAIVRTLRETDGNRTHAAKILGISRRTLQNKIKEYDIDL
ncbi:MAG: response regulator [Candidatus Eisenbacteria bacterium]|nr:response regulator [Candidatus Eisenbacteria bacterium]